MEDKVETYPNPEQVRMIFKEIYNLYVKYRGRYEDEDWISLVEERRQLQRTYPFKMCKAYLLEIVDVLEKNYRANRKVSNGEGR